MPNEIVTVILCCLVIICAVGLFFYNKKSTSKKSDAVNTFGSIAINLLTTYIEENGKTDAKNFDDITDYVIYVKDYLVKSLSDTIADNQEIPATIKKLLTNEMVDDIIDNMINEQFAVLEETFTTAKKKTKKSKKQTEAV